MSTRQEILYAYRDIYRTTLRAIRYSIPARYVARDHIRAAFRSGQASDFDSKKITRTLEFLEYANQSRGFEHKLLKNILHVWWGKQNRQLVLRGIKKGDFRFYNEAYDDFDDTLKRLNESMGLCLK